MKIYTSLLLIILVNLTQAFSKTKVDNQQIDDLISEGGKLYRLENLDFKRFWAPKSALKISNKPIKTFNELDLKDINSYVNSFFSCNNLDWYKNIVAKKEFFNGYNKAWFEYRNTKEFKSTYSIYVISKLFFNDYETGEEYCIVMCKYNANKSLRLLPLVLLKSKKGWILSEKDDYNLLSTFMYFKPNVIHEILNQNIPLELKTKFIGNNGFKLNRDFSFNMVVSTDENMPFPNLMLKHQSFTENNKEINDSIAYASFSYEIECSNSNIKLFKYNSLANSKSDFGIQHLINVKAKYDSIPEVALSSWLFTKNISEKIDNSIGFEKIKLDALNYIEKSGYHNRIEWLYKVTFDCNGVEYVIIYFSEWYGEITERLSYKEKFVGNKSILLKKMNGKWKCCFDNEENPIRLLNGIDKLNLEGVKFCFDGIKTGDNSIDLLIDNQGLGLFVNQPDKRIYINKFVLGDTIQRFVYDLPRHFKNGFGIIGPQDFYHQNNNIYWMNRK